MEYDKKGEVPEVSKDEYKTESDHDPKFLKRVADQVMAEFRAGEDHIRPWRETKRGYLKLYLNQRKNPKRVGDTLMFSSHQTILASLHQDRLGAEWQGREEEDIDRAEQLNAVWEFDYDQMGKSRHDYGKYFDATGYGIAIEDWSHFDTDSLTPIPDLWDPLSFVYDPKATSINGNRLRRGACRFIYREVSRTKEEMDGMSGFFDVDALKYDESELSEYQRNQEARNEARGTSAATWDELKENKCHLLRAGYTWIDGDRYLVEVGKDGKRVVRLQKIKTGYWPLQDHRIYPDPHVFLTPGTWDFTEDKQRARAILQNYTLDAAKFDVQPEWIIDTDRITNKQQLREHKPGKFIEGRGDVSGAIVPLQKPTIHQFSQGIMQELEMNAQKALATPEIQQGILFSQKRTATEIAEASANVDTRYSLTASLFASAEADAAMMWLDQYKRHFKKGIAKKTVRVVGAFGPKPMDVTSDTFDFKSDPDVKIESRFVSQARKREQRNSMALYGQVLLQTPGSNLRRYAKDMGRLMFRKAEVDAYLPPTIDEMRAEDENELLSANKLEGSVNGMQMKVEIEPTDDHRVHLEVHGKAGDTRAKFAHIEAHKRALMVQRNSPEMFAGISTQEPLPGQQPGLPTQGPPGRPQDAVQELISG